MGFPIRKSADQRLFAPPHGLSQRTTSFIASQRQGIHRIPLRHLIALIINTHPSAEVIQLAPYAGVIERPFASNISENVAVKPHSQLAARLLERCEARSSARMQITRLPLDKRSDMFPLHDDRQHAFGASRTNANSVYPRTLSSLFRERAGNLTVWWSQTGSNRRPHACKARALPTELWPQADSNYAIRHIGKAAKMVGLGRLELPTSRLSSARSNQLSYKPNYCPAASFAHRLFPKSLTTFRAYAAPGGLVLG